MLCFWTVVLEKTLQSPLDCKENQPIYPKGNQSWVFVGRTAVEAETPILWPSHVKSWLIWKHPDAGKDWRREENGLTEDEKVGWHHRLKLWWWTGRPACCSPWGRKEPDTTERLNWVLQAGIEPTPNCPESKPMENRGSLDVPVWTWNLSNWPRLHLLKAVPTPQLWPAWGQRAWDLFS